LEEAITETEEVAQATPKDHPDLAVRLSNLRDCLSRRYELARNLQDGENAMAHPQNPFDTFYTFYEYQILGAYSSI